MFPAHALCECRYSAVLTCVLLPLLAYCTINEANGGASCGSACPFYYTLMCTNTRRRYPRHTSKHESSGSRVSGTSSGWRKHKHNPTESGIQASRATTPFREVALESFASLPEKSGSTLDYRHLSSCTYVLCALKGICCGLSVLPIRRYPKPGGVVASHPTPGNMFTDAYARRSVSRTMPRSRILIAATRSSLDRKPQEHP